jgi:hypothetical protein
MRCLLEPETALEERPASTRQVCFFLTEPQVLPESRERHERGLRARVWPASDAAGPVLNLG